MKTHYLKQLGLLVLDQSDIQPNNLYFYNKLLKIFTSPTENKNVNKAKQILLSLMNESRQYANNPYAFYTPSNPAYLMTIKHRPEVYLPIAILKDGRVCGGGYFFPLLCGNAPIHKNLFKVFVSGMCMFGHGLNGLDQNGICYELTDPKSIIPNESVIGSIRDENSNRNSPYENLILGMLENLIGLFRAISDVADCKMIFHLPVIEYVLYGVKLLLRKQMTLDAFNEYRNLLNSKGDILQQQIKSIFLRHHMDVIITSPLEHLREAIDRKIAREIPTIENVFAAELSESLFESSHPENELWRHGLDASEQQIINFQKLIQVSYAMHLAIAAKHYGSMHVCLIDIANEIPIGLLYKTLFSEKLGSLLALYWLPPILLHDDAIQSFYHNKINGTKIDELIKFATNIATKRIGVVAAEENENYMHGCILKKCSPCFST